MPEVDVNLKNEEGTMWLFDVDVTEGDTKTTHEVTVSRNDYERLTDMKIQPAELVQKSFNFLLSKEPKESILKKFDLMEIQKYFPEYESFIMRI